MARRLDIAILGQSLRSASGSGHATIWRGLVRALLRRGHRVRFHERDRPAYAENRDLPDELAACLRVYGSVEALRATRGRDIADADVVILGSCVPEGAQVANWLIEEARGIVAFYDLDTPVTLAKLCDGTCDYVRTDQVGRFDLYLSVAGGPLLERLQRQYGARARPLYGSVDAERFAPLEAAGGYDLGYLGSCDADRQRLLRWYMLGVAAAWPEGRFAIAGSRYPAGIAWPGNVTRIEHLPSARHRAFYAAQRFTLHLTPADTAGCAPSVRLFEAAACGVPVISNAWPGIETLFAPGEEILLAQEPGQVLDWLQRMPDSARRQIGAAARRRVLDAHTAAHRAETLEGYLEGAAAHVRAAPVERERVS